MWADVVLQIERMHVLRLLFWGAVSTIAGTALLAILLARGRRSALIRQFAGVCTLLGALELVAGVIDYQHLALRDLSGATRLERLAWFQLGLYLGLVGVGVAMWAVGRKVASRAGAFPNAALPAIGGGVAVALHGLALATLELLLIAALSR